MKINVLTADVYNKIAAGEVVDRPYSVVKELVENAIDAGATEITIETEGGGKQLIRITDNGGGISFDDLPRAFLPHATSKLSTANDLERILTLGFRGEAIASIASVSRMKILSKTKNGKAYSLSSEGGKMGAVKEDAGADGTVVTVGEVFFNTPARRKFLKSDSQEDGDIAAMVARFILSRPEIAFTYYIDGRVKYRSLGDGLKAALAAVYGAGILENVLEISAEKHGLSLKGFIGNQNFSKSNRSYANLFVNGRYVINQTVATAITNAYGAYLMKRQFPFYVLFLEVPPEILDVNVHPNKTDVRFADNRIVFGFVYSIVSAVLDGSARALEYTVTDDKQAVSPVIERPVSVAPQEVKPPHVVHKSDSEPPRMNYEQAKKELEFDLSPVKEGGFKPRFGESEERNIFEVNASREQPQEDYFAENKKYLETLDKGREKFDVASLEYKGELFHTYLIYERGDDAYFIDQHAAHERLIYDKLREAVNHRAVVSQPMLCPYVINANAQEYSFLLQNLALLRDLGFEIEEFGGASFKVSAVPVDLKDIDFIGFFQEVLSSMETLRAIKLDDILKDKLAGAACKAAVKGGEKLTDGEIKSLMQKMEGDVGLKCPHGRPVAVKMARREIEKLFKRIV